MRNEMGAANNDRNRLAPRAGKKTSATQSR
jgi:hypothetical protein